jgi:hypothetical protein
VTGSLRRGSAFANKPTAYGTSAFDVPWRDTGRFKYVLHTIGNTMQLMSFLRRPNKVPSARSVDEAMGKQRLAAISAAVGETMRMHGIPVPWVGAETLPARTPADQKGVHLRLVIRNADPKLLLHIHPLQEAILARLAQLDAQCAQWLMGTSWRLDVPLASQKCRLPGPKFWQGSSAQEPAGAPSTARPAPESPAASGVHVSAREIVSRQLAARDRAFARTT